MSGKSPTGEALKYIAKYWEGLILFLTDGRIERDSNAVERTIRPIALQRKNALFAGHDAGAQNWAMLASLIETCGTTPHRWGLSRAYVDRISGLDFSSILRLLAVLVRSFGVGYGVGVMSGLIQYRHDLQTQDAACISASGVLFFIVLRDT